MSRREWRTVPSHGTVRMRRALLLAGCGVLTVSISACESTEQESAKIAREGQQIATQAAHPHKGKHSSAHRHGRSHAQGKGHGHGKGAAKQ
jgi:hypothetical protein